MKKTASQKRRLLLTKNFILMLVMLVVIIMAVSAWFTVNKTVTANNMTVKAASSEIDIAPCIKHYNSGYTEVVSDGPGVFDSELTFSGITFNKDCTGDGVDMIVPEFNVTKDFDSVRRYGGKEVNVNLPANDAVSNKQSEIEHLKNPSQDAPEFQYAEFEFYVRSKNKNLLLESSSQLLASTEVGNQTLSTIPAGKQSAYGSFNVDGLVGAIRVALLAEGCTSVDQTWTRDENPPQDHPNKGTLSTSGNTAPNTARGDVNCPNPIKQILWVPRPDVYLFIPETERDISNWILRTGVTSQTTYNNKNIGAVTYNGNTYYKRDNVTGGVELVTADAANDKLVVSSGTGSHSVPCLGTDCNISDFTGYSVQPSQINLVVNQNDITVTHPYYVTKYTMRVWIEGTDTEARRAMDGGSFNLTLKFK